MFEGCQLGPRWLSPCPEKSSNAKNQKRAEQARASNLGLCRCVAQAPTSMISGLLFQSQAPSA